MSELYLMTNAEAARTLAFIAWVVLFFIVLNSGILVYTIIRNARAAKKAISLERPNETPVSSESAAPVKEKKKPFSLGKKKVEEEEEYVGFEMVLTDMAHPERAFYVEGKDSYLVGRRPQMDLCIPDDGYVSGTHCKFEMTDGILYITDLQSSNGTKVNGNVITERTAITQDDIVRIGKAEYKVDF